MSGEELKIKTRRKANRLSFTFVQDKKPVLLACGTTF
jgi:hypothetical protein